MTEHVMSQIGLYVKLFISVESLYVRSALLADG